jgi:hypothetical protein
MRKIFKYPIEPKETVQTIDLPKGAEVVALRTQGTNIGFLGGGVINEKLYFWAIVDPEQKLVPRRFMCVGTGWEITPNIEDYVDTAISDSGFVWHLLEIK